MFKFESSGVSRAVRVAMGAAAVAALVHGGAVRADTDTADLAVSATVTANCEIETAPLDFGSYDPVVAHKTADLVGTGTVSVTCTNGAPVTITLGQGANADTGSTADGPLRRMIAGAEQFLSYSLYSDSGHTAVWATGTEVDVATTGNGAKEDHTVYGVIAGGQNAHVGEYSDTVVATVTF